MAHALRVVRDAMEKARAQVGAQQAHGHGCQCPRCYAPAPPIGNPAPPTATVATPVPPAYPAVSWSPDECWLPCGFPVTNVLAAAVGTQVNTTVRKRFLPRIIRVPARLSSAFNFTNFEIGTDCYRISTDPWPCDMYSEENPDVCLSFRIAEVNDLIQLTVNSISLVATDFSAMIWGPPC